MNGNSSLATENPWSTLSQNENVDHGKISKKKGCLLHSSNNNVPVLILFLQLLFVKMARK